MKLLRKKYLNYKGPVYDLGVHTKDHSYIINNAVVHNSAAGCLVSYLIGLVQVDPLEYGLLFERFLNEGRLGKSLPDVDCDFEAERKAEIKTYIEELS